MARAHNPVRWTHERDARLLKAFLAGATRTQLAERFGATYPAVKHRLRALGQCKPAQAPWTLDEDDTLVDAMLDGESAWITAGKLNRTIEAVETRRRTLVKKGLRLCPTQ
jgi:hypothetical protein